MRVGAVDRGEHHLDPNRRATQQWALSCRAMVRNGVIATEPQRRKGGSMEKRAMTRRRSRSLVTSLPPRQFDLCGFILISNYFNDLEYFWSARPKT